MSSSVFSIANSGLSAAKKQMSTTSHNIANVNTEGYTRQRAELQTSRPIGRGNIIQGTGVDVKIVRRLNDELVDKKIIEAKSDESFHQERSFQLEQLEQIYNELNGPGLNKVFNDFFNSFRELSAQPENETLKSVVVEKAKSAVKDMKKMSSRLEEIESNIDKRLQLYVGDVNNILENLSKLNVRIMQLENAGGETGDLRDQRDKSLKELSQYFEIETSTNEKGQYVVNAIGVGSLLVGSHYQELEGHLHRPNNQDLPEFKIYFKGKMANNFASAFGHGKFKALFISQGQELKRSQQKMDEIAFALINQTNLLHQRGYSHSKQGEPRTGISFFKPTQQIQGSAFRIDLSEEIKADPTLVATSALMDAAGDNQIALSIASLQHQKILADGSTTVEEEYLKNIGMIGMSSAKAKVNLEQAGSIMSQLQATRERISGVSLDEEATNMTQFQHAYEASARVLRTSEEMFNSLLEVLKNS